MAFEGTALDTQFTEVDHAVRPSRYLRLVKPVLDRLVVALGLPVTLPLIAVIALLVRLTSPGPAFLHLSCVGRNGVVFRQYRFRCVHIDAPARRFRAAPGAPDPRLTPLGRFLMRTGLNSLPQVANVLAGHMSLVGPRAEAAVHARVGCGVTRLIQRVRPGLFSPDLLRSRKTLGEHDRQALALAYATKASFMTDLRVLRAAALRLLLPH